MKNNDLTSKYNEITTPEELLTFMHKNINNGYLGKNNKIYYPNDKDFNRDWNEQYVLQTSKQLLETKSGNCWDQTEFARTWFLENGYEIKTIYVMVCLQYHNDYPTHSYLVYKNKDNDGWNWFENADIDNRGIHRFNTQNDCIAYQLQTYISILKLLNIKDEELSKIIMKEFEKPKSNSSVEEYLNFVINSKDIELPR